MPLARRLVASLCLILFSTTLLSSSTPLVEGELPRERGAERERAATRTRSTTTSDDASSSSPSSPLFLPLSSVSPSSTLFRGSTLRRHANHRVYSPLWLHDGNFYALDERGSFPGDASAHVAGAATRVEALPTASAAELVATSFSSPSSLWLPTPALLLEIPWPAHVDSTAVWMEIVAGAAAAVREAIEVEEAETHRRWRERRRRPLLDLVLRPFLALRSPSALLPPAPPPPPLFSSPDPDPSVDDNGRPRRTPLPLVILLPNLDAETFWRSSPGARWAREEALPLALEAAAEVAFAAAAAADGSGGGQRQRRRQQQQQQQQQQFLSLTYLTRSDLEQLSSSKRGLAPWAGLESVLVPHGRFSTPRRDAGLGGGGAGGGRDCPEPGALAAAFRRRAWEAAGLPLGALSPAPAAAAQAERGCDPRAGGETGGGGGGRGARDIVLVSEPSPPPPLSSSSRSSSSRDENDDKDSGNDNALANFDELSSALERAALALGLRARPALLTPSTSLASAAKVAARSRVVVGRTGAALAALVPLLAPGSGVVELVPPNWEWDGSHLLVRNLTRPLFADVSKPGKGRGVLYASWRPGELPSSPASPPSLVYGTREDEERFGRWSSRECALDRECTEATARSSLRVDVAAVVDEVVLLAAALLSCDNVDFEDSDSVDPREKER